MANPFTFKFKGLDKLNKKLRDIPKELKTEIGEEIKFACEHIVQKAVQDAPADQGRLRQGITSKKVNPLQYEVNSNANYSAFVEFGTRTKVRIPAGYEDYAAQFKGAGTGTMDEFFDSIMQWVIRKGLTATFSVKTKKRQRVSSSELSRAHDIAYLIMLKILRVGIEPHPFFFHNFENEKPQLIGRVEAVLKDVFD